MNETPTRLTPHDSPAPAIGATAAGALRILSATEVRDARRRDAGQWASLDELGDDGQVHAAIMREFPDLADRWDGDPVGRRRFLEIMGASLALAGVAGTTGCARQAPEKIVPYVKPPAGRTPGDAQYFATSMPLEGASLGLLVKSFDGRPIKIEGNPEHPDSLGATDAFAQAALLGLYDPDRSQIVLGAGAVSTWQAFHEALDAALAIEDGRGGAGLRILTGTIDSPTLLGQLAAILARYPQAKWCQYEPAVAHLKPLGAGFAFPQGPFTTHYRLAEANVIVALDADFLHDGPGAVRYSRDFAERRRAYSDRPLNRLYSIETTLSVTGAAADHRLALRPSRIPAFAAALASAVGVDLGTIGVSAAGKLDARETRWVDALAADLLANRGKSAIIAGREQQALVQAFAHLMNEQLGNVGATVRYVKAEAGTNQSGLRALEGLAEDLKNGEVGLLLILGGNPAYNAPANLDFANLIGKAAFSAHLSLYEDETSALCGWHLPAAHFLESWGDGRAVDGTLTTRQPLIAPLYEGKTEYELLAAVMRQPQRTNLDIVKQAWRERYQGSDFEGYWRTAIHDGLVADSAPQRSPESVISPATPLVLGLDDEAKPTAQGAATSIELSLRLDPTIYDGRFANNGWLQELPKPLTKLTWDNAVLLSPTTAKELGVVNEQVVELEHGGRNVRGPVWILPGQADGCATVHLGYGRRAGGRVAKGAGFDAYPLWTSAEPAAPWAEPAAPWTVFGVTIRPTTDRFVLACTQTHSRMEGRHLARSASLAEYQRDPAFARKYSHGVTGGPQRGEHDHADHGHAHDDETEGDHAHGDESLFPSWKYTGHAWGMSIDLGSCIGCNACVVACQAENNIPVVGKQQVINGREMHWLRIDRYWEGPEESPDSTRFQPVACMHCEQAPCEIVCPVAATVHSAEGLNDMVYNRCVGTRYCSNNCPYKVRRFNFLQFADETTPSLKLLNNPEVTVRSRGVMEKCTYCVQRIDNARIKETVDGHPLVDGALVTACQQACPAQAIVFGDLNDPNSEVSRRKALPLDYGLLTELNTRPRTSYLAQVRNPNPALAALEAPA